MIVIGIGHRARQGKDTVAKFMIMELARRGIYGKQYGFADALRATCSVNFGMKEKNGRLLQLVGTELYRDQVDRNFWVNILEHTIRREAPDAAIITDMRFNNEVQWVEAQRGVTVKVERYGPDNMLMLPNDRDPNHPSEIAIQGHPWAHIIRNDSDLKHLKTQTLSVLEDILSNF